MCNPSRMFSHLMPTFPWIDSRTHRDPDRHKVTEIQIRDAEIMDIDSVTAVLTNVSVDGRELKVMSSESPA